MHVCTYLQSCCYEKRDMSVHRSKKHGNVCKENTVHDAPGKCFVFSYEITFRYPNIAPFVKA